MFPSSNRKSLLEKMILACIWLYLLTGKQQNKVDAASFATLESVRESTDSCQSVCNDSICHDEASRLKSMMDENVDPCDDFYHFVCGQYINTVTVNDEFSTIGMFNGVQNIIDRQLHTALRELNTSHPKSFVMIQSYYRNCVEQEEDMNMILKILESIGGFPLLLGDNWNETAYNWKEALYKVIDEGTIILFPVFVQAFNGISNATRDIPMVMNAQTFIKKHFSVDDIRTYYNFVFDSVLTLGPSQNISEVEMVELMYFEINLMNITSSDEIIANQTTNEKITTVKSLSKKYPNIPWLELFSRTLNRYNISIDSSDVILMQDKQFIDKLAKLINQTPKRTIANYIAWNVLRTFYMYLPKQFNQLRQKYHLNRFAEREQFCLNEVKKSFSIAADALYVRKYIPYFWKERNQDIENLGTNIKRQIKTVIKKAKWMDDDTRRAALKKVNKMHTLIGHEKELLDDNKIDEYYSKLELTTDSFLKSFIALFNFEYGKQLKSLDHRHEKIRWFTRGSAVNFNAEYGYAKNAIDVPAGLTQMFMYVYGRPNYLNYGSLGSIVGHEIIHGFDNVGRTYDENGLLNNWWSSVAEKKYVERAQCLIRQFNSFKFQNLNLTVNGERTLKENIADNGGFKAAYYAYTKWVEQNGIAEECLPNLNYTPKQLFWISSAMNWCSKDAAGYIKNLINTDPHPPSYARVLLSYSNFEEFAEDFKCKAGSRMNPEKRCNLY